MRAVTSDKIKKLVFSCHSSLLLRSAACYEAIDGEDYDRAYDAEADLYPEASVVERYGLCLVGDSKHVGQEACEDDLVAHRVVPISTGRR